MRSKISKEKQILIESYDKRSQNKQNTISVLDKMMNYRRQKLKNSREEQYQNHIEDFKSQGETFDISKMGFSQKQKVSPTSKSNVRSFRNLHEQRMYEDSIELQEIIKELEE